MNWKNKFLSRFTKYFLAVSLFLGVAIASAAWQGTAWILTGESINSVKLKANFDYLYSLWKRTANDLFYTDGNVGIGTSTPLVSLDIAGSLRIGKDNIVCDASTKGVMSYDSATSKLEICDGTTWTSVVDPNSLNISAGWKEMDVQVYSQIPNGTSWETLDISSTVGQKSTLVSLEVCSSGTENPWVAFRPSGETSEWRQWNAFSASANSATPGNGFCGEVVVPTGPDGKLELLGENTATVTVTLRGYIGGSATATSTQVGDNDWLVQGNNVYTALPGNVGVGVQNPAYKLQVAGDIAASSTKLSGAVWSPLYCDQNGQNCKSITELGSGGGSLSVIETGFVSTNSEVNMSSDWSYLSLNGQGVNSDSGPAGGYIRKVSSGIYTAALFSGTSYHREFTLSDTYQCTSSDAYMVCAKITGGDVYIKTGAAAQLSYAKLASSTGSSGSSSSDNDWAILGNNIYTMQSGFVGIGTNAPLAKLHIDSSTNDKIRLSGTQTDPHTIFLSGTQGLRFWDDDNGELLRITEIGNVGIGTNNPTEKLTVAGNSSFIGSFIDFWFNNTSDTTAGIDTTFRIIANDGTGNFHKYINTNGGATPTRQTDGYAFHERFDPGVGEYRFQTSVYSTAGTNISWIETLALKEGNVGIGTTNPGTKLQVSGDTKSSNYIAGNNAVRINGTDNVTVGPDIEIASQGLIATQSNLFINIDSDNNENGAGLYFKANGNTSSATDLMVIKDTGNVGIGTTSPSSKLEVAGNIEANAYCDRNGQNCSTASDIATVVSGGPSLWTASGNNIYRDTGNVGIGTTNPSYKLTISGNIATIGHSTNPALLELGQDRTGNGYAYIDLHGDTTYADYGLRILRGSTGPNAWSEIRHRGTSPFYLIAHDAADVRIRTNDTDRLTVKANTGNVGIGTTNPGEKLDVAGTARVQALQLNGNTPAHINSDGVLYRIGGQAYLTIDDNFYIRDTNGDLSFRFISGDSPDIRMGTNTTAGWNSIWMYSTPATKTLRIHGMGDNTNQLRFGRYGNNYGSWEANPVVFDIDAPDRTLFVHESGMVGIGGTPANKLHVFGIARVDGGLAVDGKMMISGDGYRHTAQSTSNSRYGYFEARRSDGNRGFYLGYGNGSSVVNLYLDSASRLDITGGNVYMSGNVGIGTTSPSSKLEVVGNIEANAYCDRNGQNCSTASDIYNLVTGVSGDNLGNHIATQNLQMAGNWINGDGGNGGIKMSTTGQMILDSESSLYDLWIQGGASTAAGTSRNLALLGYDNDSGDYLYINYNGEYTRGVRIGSSLGINVLPTTGTFNNGKAIALGDNDTGIRQDGDGILELWTNNAERVHVAANGNVGIGTPSPAYKLDVNGTISFDSINVGRGTVWVENNANDNADGAGITIRTNNNPTTNGGAIFAVRSSGQAPRLWVGQAITSTGWNHLYVGTDTNDGKTNPKIQLLNNGNAYFNGNVGIGTTAPSEKLDVNGNVKATAFLYSSDKRLKTDIKTINGLELIDALRGVSFKWKENGEKSMGLIAQEVEKVAPELVKTDKNTGLKSVLYANLVAPLIEAIKELHQVLLDIQDKLAELFANDSRQDKEIQELKARLSEQERIINELKNKLKE